jgi:7-keto-8-aminopelargonate synthetase-like enzyme
VASAAKVFDLLNESTSLIEKVAQNTQLFRTNMKQFGFNILVRILIALNGIV